MSYCTAEEVFNQGLPGYDLTKIGANATAQKAYIETLLPSTTTFVNELAGGRDFLLHEDDVVQLDGSGTDQVVVWKDDRTLCSPIISVEHVKVYDVAQDLASLKINFRTGIVGYQAGGSERLAVRRARSCNGIFPRDFQNVEIKLTWGFTDPPENVKQAQIYITAANVLMVIAGAVSAGAKFFKVRDFEVGYGAAGPYAPQIQHNVLGAQSLVNGYRTGRRSR